MKYTHPINGTVAWLGLRSDSNTVLPTDMRSSNGWIISRTTKLKNTRLRSMPPIIEVESSIGVSLFHVLFLLSISSTPMVKHNSSLCMHLLTPYGFGEGAVPESHLRVYVLQCWL